MLVAEAGTGTGKTYAYLVPALLNGGRSSSTGTKNTPGPALQPRPATVRAALKVPVAVALLKGRSNYVCHYHLARNLVDGRFTTPEDAGYLRAIGRFMEITQTGDKAECPEVPEDAAAWMFATSSGTTASARSAPTSKCFVAAARRAAMDADVVVVNHHLFFADVSLRDGGMGELLPSCNAVIFDEAHQLPRDRQPVLRRACPPPSSSSSPATPARDRRRRPRLPRPHQATRKARKGRPRPAPHHRHRQRPLRLRPARRTTSPSTTRWTPSTPSSAVRHHRRDPGQRSEGLAACRRTQKSGRLARWQVPEATSGALGRVFSQSLALNATPCRSPRSSSARWTATRGPGSSPRPRWRWGATSATTAASSASTGSSRPSTYGGVGQPLRLPEAGHALRPAEHARPQRAGLPRRRRPGRLSADPRSPRAHLRAAPRCGRCGASTRSSPTGSKPRLELPLLIQGEGSRSAPRALPQAG